MHDEQWLIQRYRAIPDEERSAYTFLSLKIKRFRTFNRLFGRAAGDELIEKVYQRIDEWCKPGDYLAHIGLDYFNALLRLPRDYEGLFQQTIALNRQIRDMPDERFFGEVFSGMGFYPLPSEPVDFYTAQYNADICRSECREKDYRNSHFEVYGVTFHDPNLRYFDLRRAIKPALDHGDIKLYLQPKVDLRTGRVDSAEALVRWADPEKGLIPPSEFIQGLEDNGLIEDVDTYLFDLVCGHINRWLETYGRRITISVNLSSCAFNYRYFFEDYRKVYEKYQTPKECIQFELVESSILNQVERVREVVGELRDFGFSCALDDFGSGFSNFGVLATEGFSVLKIDRSLFQDEHNQREQALLRHIIGSAHDLGMSVVAEGVESQGYLDFLRESGCEYVQGFVFYRPMPVEEFEARFLKNGERVQI